MREYAKIKEVIDHNGIGSFVYRDVTSMLESGIRAGILLRLSSEGDLEFDVIGIDRGVRCGYWVDRRGNRVCSFEDSESLDGVLDILTSVFTLPDEEDRLNRLRKIHKFKLDYK